MKIRMDDQNQQPTQPVGDQGAMPQAPVQQPEPQMPTVEEPAVPSQPASEPTPPAVEPEPAPQMPTEQPGGTNQGGQQPGTTL